MRRRRRRGRQQSGTRPRPIALAAPTLDLLPAPRYACATSQQLVGSCLALQRRACGAYAARPRSTSLDAITCTPTPLCSEAAWPLGVLEARGLGSFHVLDALRKGQASATGGGQRLSLWQEARGSATEPLPPLVDAALRREHTACSAAQSRLSSVSADADAAPVLSAAEWRRVERARAPARFMLAASGALPQAEPGGPGHTAALRAGVGAPSPSWAAGQAHLALALVWLHGGGVPASARQAAYHAADAAVASGVHFHLRGHQPLNEHKLVAVEAHREAAVDRGARPRARDGRRGLSSSRAMPAVATAGERGEDDERIQHRIHQAAAGDVEAQLGACARTVPGALPHRRPRSLAPVALADAGSAYYYGVRGLPRDQGRARELFGQAAAAGSPEGQAAFADMLIKGEGGPANATAAVGLYELAAEHELVRALNGLGYAYFLGRGTAANVTRARELFDRAASLGREPDSMFNAAILHLEGRGGPANLTRAHELFEAAADVFNHFGAKQQLGSMALRGEVRLPAIARAMGAPADARCPLAPHRVPPRRCTAPSTCWWTWRSAGPGARAPASGSTPSLGETPCLQWRTTPKAPRAGCPRPRPISPTSSSAEPR